MNISVNRHEIDRKSSLIFDQSNCISKLIFLFLFNSLTSISQDYKWNLKSCIDTAFINNFSIAQNINTSKISEINLNQSKANLLPTFNGNISQAYNSGRSLNPVSYQFTTGNVLSNNFSLNGVIPIFTGLQNKNTIKQNQLIYESAFYDLEQLKNDLIISIVNCYLQVLFATELVHNSQNQLELTIIQVDKTKLFYDAGIKLESDLLQLKADLANKKLVLTNAKGQLKNAKLNLQQLINIPIKESFDIEYPTIIEPESIILDGTKGILETAITNQPSIKSSQLKTQSFIFAIKSSKGILLPRLTLAGNIATNYSNASKKIEVTHLNSYQNIGFLESNPNETVIGNIAQPIYNSIKYPFEKQIKDNLYKSLSISISIPILNRQTHYNINKQMINLENSKLNEKIAISNLQKNIEKAYTDVENGVAKYNATKELVQAFSESFRNSNLKYNNQLLNIYELLVEKNKYSQAQSDNIQAKYELIFYLKILDYYKGIPIVF